MNMMLMQINVCRVQADMIFDNGAHIAVPPTTRFVQLPEIPQVQYEVNDATDNAPAFINFRMFVFVSLDPVSTHYN